MADELRKAIERDGRSLAALAAAAGIDTGQLSRFIRSERSLTLDTADAVCAALRLKCQLVPNKQRRKQGR